MIQTNATQKAFPTFRVLTDDQIQELTAAALDILEKVGIKVFSQKARTMFQNAGALVDQDSVKLPRFIVRQALATAPKGWTVYNRDGSPAFEAAGRKSSFGTATASPTTRDPFSGEIRETRGEDIALAARVANVLEHIDWVMPMGSVQDAPDRISDIEEFLAVVQHTGKPLLFCCSSTLGAEWICRMAAEMAGGPDHLRRAPFLVLYSVPLTPLILPEDTLENLFLAADYFLPQMTGPTMQPGATSPVTLAGAVAQGLVESLACLTAAQLRNPGCPIGLGCNFTNFDMHQGLVGLGNPEMSLALAAQAEVAQALGLPTLGLAGSTDAKVLDAQAGAEAAFHLLAQAQAGLNMIHDVGYMDMSMVCSLEQLVLGNEIIGMVKRFLDGIEVSREAIALEVIKAVGHGGHFLGQEHTMQHFKAEQWRPQLFSRTPHSLWQAQGSPTTEVRVREQIHSMLKIHQPPALSLSVLDNLERMRKEANSVFVNQAS